MRGVWERDPAKILVNVAGAIEKIAEEMEECEVIDELRWLIRVELSQIVQHILFHVLDQILVVPHFREPLLKLLAVAITVNDEVQFDIVASTTQAETSDGEIGATENRVFHSAGSDVIHLSVKQVRLFDGFDVDFLFYPRGALFGYVLLLKFVGKLQPFGINDERFHVRLAGVKAIDR